MKIVITKKEQKAIKSLERLAKTWPQSLELFSVSGILLVSKKKYKISAILGIPNTGGDPGDKIKLSDFEIEYEK